MDILTNPITKIRKELDLFQNGLALACGVSTSTIYYVEKGQFVSIPGRIHKYLATVIEDYNPRKLEKEYHQWIKHKRKLNTLLVPPLYADMKLILPRKMEDYRGKHPLKYYLDYWKINPSKFCDVICIPKNPYHSYVRGTQEDMPEIIYEALIDAGFGYQQIELLDRLGAEFYRYAQTTRIAKRRINVRTGNKL